MFNKANFIGNDFKLSRWRLPFLGSTCSKNEFICKDGTCVDLNDQCNGRFECPDQSDELDCQGK
jgi:hypothetical protein